MAEAGCRQPKTETLAKFYDGKLRLERRNGAPNGSLIDRPSTPWHRPPADIAVLVHEFTHSH
jgi:hypothetical protein